MEGMESDLKTNTAKSTQLEEEVKLCSLKLGRAEKLIGGLGEEKARWTAAAEQLQVRMTGLTLASWGNPLLPSSCLPSVIQRHLRYSRKGSGTLEIGLAGLANREEVVFRRRLLLCSTKTHAEAAAFLTFSWNRGAVVSALRNLSTSECSCAVCTMVVSKAGGDGGKSGRPKKQANAKAKD